MASDYGVNFGFRISDETRRSSAGRWRTPVGSALRLGTAVEHDPDAADQAFVRQCASGAKLRTGVSGLLVQEEAWDRGIDDARMYDSYSSIMGIARANRLSVVTSGPGTKIWLKNTNAQNRSDGRVIDAVEIFDPTNVAVGRGLAWNGTQWVDVADPTAATAWMEVTEFNDDTAGAEYLEAVLRA